MSKMNKNYMAIPKHPRPLTASSETTFEASVLDATHDWYGAIVTEEAAVGEIEFEDITIDFTGFPMPAGTPIYGNIKKITMSSGAILVHVYKG